MYNFDKVINRKGTNCLKWDLLKDIYGKDEVESMWIADMDFEVSPHIISAMQKILDTKIFGYQFVSDNYYKAIINWMKRRHDFIIDKEWICYSPNVVAALSYAIQAITDPGDEIIIQTPTYGPFFSVVKDNNRVLLESKMKNNNGYYTMDLEDFESKITEKTKATIFCNPHNPSGRVWTKDELKKFADICIKHNLYIISDDIHSELVMKNHKHTMIATLSDEIAEKTITCTSPSKAFNLASLHLAHCIIKNEEVRKKFKKPFDDVHIGENAFAEAVITSAYNESEKWLDELMDYIEKNVDYFVNYVKREIPKLKVYKPEGTYLVWVDCIDLNIPADKLKDFFCDKCNVAIHAGKFFGEEGCFIRFNLACNINIVKQALENIKREVSKLQ